MNFKVLFFVFVFCNYLGLNAQQTNPSETKFPEAKAYNGKVLTYKIINTPNSTFCYDIYADNKLMIHQPSIPGVQGNDGFKTKSSAEKVAGLVISKIKKGEMPPTVTVDEMKKLKALP